MVAQNIKVIDAHLHYGADPAIAEHLTDPYIRYDDPESVIKSLDHYGVAQAVLLPPDRILNPPADFDYRIANEAVARAVVAFPERLIGVMRINPLFGEEFVWTTVKHFVENHGFHGIKLVARADFYNPANLKVMGPVMEAAEHYDITILFHSGHPARDLPSLQSYSAKNFPQTRVVLAHMGLHDYLSEAIIACKELPNVYADMSQSWPYDIKNFVASVGPEKLMFGSDGPFQSSRVERVKIEECNFPDWQNELIFHKNAERIWRISAE